MINTSGHGWLAWLITQEILTVEDQLSLAGRLLYMLVLLNHSNKVHTECCPLYAR